jgi:hypothetical protein
MCEAFVWINRLRFECCLFVFVICPSICALFLQGLSKCGWVCATRERGYSKLHQTMYGIAQSGAGWKLLSWNSSHAICTLHALLHAHPQAMAPRFLHMK